MSRGRTARRVLSDEKGLSLLELIVVLVIIGLVAALSAPTLYREWRHVQSKRAATSLAALLRYAHQQAILTKETQIVRIDFDGQTTRLLRAAPTGSEDDEGTSPPPRALATYRFPPTVRPRLVNPDRSIVIEAGQRDILFYPTGYSTGEAIELISVLGRVYRIVIDPVTGVTTISREAS